MHENFKQTLSLHYVFVVRQNPELGKLRYAAAGVCQQSLMGHAGPIFSLKWNKKGDLLLTGSLDRTAIVWNAKAGAIKQQFSFHSGD